MAIDFPCPNCGAPLHAPDEYGGGTARCEHCAARVRIPKVALPPASRTKPVPDHTIIVACPNCKERFHVELQGQALAKDLLVACDHCGVEKKLAAFQKELGRQVKSAAKQRARLAKVEVRKQKEERRKAAGETGRGLLPISKKQVPESAIGRSEGAALPAQGEQILAGRGAKTGNSKRPTTPGQAIVATCTLVAMGILAFATLDTESNPSSEASPSSTRDRPDKITAWVMAQDFVQQHLKSPSTADFGGLFSGDYQDPNECCVALDSSTFRCRGFVDAQNSFGATMRSHFTCTLRYVGDQRWQLKSIDIY